MKARIQAKMEPDIKSISSWRGIGIALLSLALLPLAAPAADARVNEDLPELPGFEVTSMWALHNLTPPVAEKVVSPVVNDEFIGTTVRMTFILDKDGKARSIKHNGSRYDDNQSDLGAKMRAVLSYWKFTPALDKNGEAVKIRVALPVKVVADGEQSNADRYAGLRIKEPVLLAVLDR